MDIEPSTPCDRDPRRAPASRRRRCGRPAGGILTAILLIACAGTTAHAFPSRALYRTQRLCSAPARDRAGCLGIRLIARSLSGAALRANAGRQARELASGVAPHVSSTSVPGGLTPAALHQAYRLPSETPAADTQTIGIVDAFNDPTAEADLAVYDRQFGLPECTTANGCLRKLNQTGRSSPLPATNGGWATEISLDLQMAHAICETCRIVLVEASSETWGSLGAAVNAAAAAGASEISNSYGGPEFSSYAGLSSPYYDHPGVVVTVSSGDCGYFNQGCAGWTAAANFPAAAPHVVAVGGTSLSGSGESWTSTVWSGGGSGCSSVFAAPPWQSAVETFAASGCGEGRSVADVAAVADPYTGVDIYDSTPGRQRGSDRLGRGRRHVGGLADRRGRVRARRGCPRGALSRHHALLPSRRIRRPVRRHRREQRLVCGRDGLPGRRRPRRPDGSREPRRPRGVRRRGHPAGVLRAGDLGLGRTGPGADREPR